MLMVSWMQIMLKTLTRIEAEYMALTEAVKESIWLKRLLIVGSKTKHINVRYHFIREIMESKEIEVAKIDTKDNAGNAFTKAATCARYIPRLNFDFVVIIVQQVVSEPGYCGLEVRGLVIGDEEDEKERFCSFQNCGTMMDADKTAAWKTYVYKKARNALLSCLDNKVLSEVNKEDSVAGVWLKLETLYMTKSLANKLYLKKKLFTFYMHSDAKDDGDGLYVRRRSDHQGNQGRGSSRSKSKGKETYKLKFYICYSEDQLKKEYPKRNKKKSTGFVKKNVGQGSDMHFEGYDNGDLLMAVSEERFLKWIMDSGGSFHMTPRRDFLFDFKEFNGGTVLLADNRARTIRKTGKVRVQMKDGSSFVLENVRYILELKRNLISLGTLDREGYTVKLQNGRVKVIKGSLMVLSKGNCVYSLDGLAESGEASVGIQENKSLAHVWHKRVGHISEAGLHELERRDVLGNKGLGLLLHAGKLKLRAIKCIFLRYPDGVKGYKLWRLDDVKPKIIIRRDVVFNESLTYKDTLKGVGVVDSRKEVEFEVELPDSKVEPTVDPHTRENPRNKDEEQDEEPQQQIMDNYVLVRDRAKRTTTIPARYRDEGNVSLSRPSGSKDEWVRVMKKEMSSLKKNYTWELVDQPLGQKLVSCKWLYKIKEGIKGIQKSRYKARLVARGFTQRAGIDYNEVFSPMIRHTSIRVILSLTTCEDYELEQLDVKMTFFHGNLEETIYMRQPPSFEEGTSNKQAATTMIVVFTSRSLHQELGPTRNILRMEIVRDMDSRTLKVSQSGYVQKILNNYRMDNAKPDIAYVVSIVSRYYLKGTANVGLVYGRDQGKYVDVDGIVDADYAKDTDKDRSITGYMFMAEYMAITEAVKESIWLKRLLIELGVKLRSVVVNCDNQSAIHLSRNAMFHERTKHINVRYHFIKEIMKSKEIEVAKIDMKDNAGNAFTKVVSGPKFKYCMEILGVGINQSSH
nr:retrovirus-related Pol polyprotein from transposon TNT 1-94 [Tanacetum cinerariifolium]